MILSGYGLKYKCGYSSLQTTGWVYIYLYDYTDSADVEETLVTADDSIEIRYNWRGWEDPIIGLNASFSIINNKTDFFELLPLLTATEKQYWIQIVEVSPTAQTLFEGFLNCKDNEVQYLQKSPIRLNASSYLSKLQYVSPSTIETLEKDSFINIIDDCLTRTGAEYDICVNCSLVPTEDILGTTKTLFNLTGVYKEVFWKDNIDRDSCLEILKKILITFDCYICWYNGYWWIERYADIWNTSKDWVIYETGASGGYTYGSTGSAGPIEETIHDVVDLIKLNTSQMIGMISGKKQIEIDIEQQLIFNLVVNNLEEAAITSDDSPEPDIRRWLLWEGDDSDSTMEWNLVHIAGNSWRTIAKAVQRFGWDYDGGTFKVWRGMYSAFRATITQDSVIDIEFKFGAYVGLFIADWDELEIKFNWYLRSLPGNYYITYNDSSEEWERSVLSEENAIQTTTVQGTEFDEESGVVTVSISIAIGDASDSSWEGDQDFILCIGTEMQNDAYPLLSCYYGDVRVRITGELTDNYISGSVNSDFLNKLSIQHLFGDIVDLSVKNGVFRSVDYASRTIVWEDALSESDAEYTLAEIKLRDKFLFYNKNRQKITSQIQSIFLFKPFALFIDSKQAGLYFVLVGFAYKPQRDMYDIILSEYDNTETVNLI